MFFLLKIADIRAETSDCVSIALEVPNKLREKFQFEAGQYLTFRTKIAGEEVRRSYSICSSPFEDELRVAVKKVPHGKFSTWANDTLKVGDYLDTMPPNGRFCVQTNVQNAKKYIGIAVGSGITPILSMLKTVLNGEPNSHFTLIYGNKSKNSIIFKEAIEALKNKYMARFSVYYILSQEVTDAAILYGRLNEEKLTYFFKKIVPVPAIDEFFICGPEEMILTTTNQLQALKVPKKKIHFELFTTTKPQNTPPITTHIVNTIQKSQVTIRLDGLTFKMPIAYEGENILDEATKRGTDLPYACKGGVCCTCKAKLIEGEVMMRVNYGLEPEEIAAGFILTCQAQPRTAVVVVDFDIK